MSIATYDELKSAIANWMHRTDLATRIPDFIALAEVRINKLARVRQMEIEAPLVMVVGSRFITLPAGFNEPRAVWLEDIQPREQLTVMTPEQLPVFTEGGRPCFWAIDGSNLAFDQEADAAYPITLRYRGKVALSDAVPTNSLLTDYPDVYLAAGIVEAATYARNIDVATLWNSRFKEAVKDMNAIEGRSRSIAPLRSDHPSVMTRISNIFRG